MKQSAIENRKSKIPLISLCVIAGNEEVYIERFIESFAPCFDELCVVRATGNQKPDKTLAIAKKHGARTGIYHNDEEAADRPHVDNFAAARNQAFRMARGKYILWADIDDTIPLDHAKKIRAHAEKGEFDVYCFQYSTGNDNCLFRRRLVRNGIGAKWISPLHEDLWVPQTATYADDSSIVFQHRPNGFKHSSLDRNLWMIKHRLWRHADWLYYLQQDLFLAGRYEEAIPEARKALAMPELGDCERYETLLNMAHMLKEMDERKRCAMEAVLHDPRRREAVCMLACLAIDEKDYAAALAWARMFNVLPIPRPKPWNHKGRFYDWLGVHLACQCMRLGGLESKATETEVNLFKESGALFSLVHGTRGRPQKCLDVRAEWFQKARNPRAVEHIFGVDHFDKETIEVIKGHRHVVCYPGNACCPAYNEAAKHTIGKVIIAVSDDTHPPTHWDELLLKRLGPKIDEEAAVFVSDGQRDGKNSKLQTTQIMTRKRYEKQGNVIYGEGYLSMYGDQEFTWRAMAEGIAIEAFDITFPHKHPLHEGKGLAADATYAHTNAAERYAQGEKLYRERNPGAPLRL